MRLVTSTVWTNRRKWLGNLIPALFWLPPAVIGVYLIAFKNQLTGAGVWYLVASTVLGWAAVNVFGLFENSRMRRQLEHILQAKGTELGSERYFVGFATPSYSSMLDAHEDVGFLVIHKDRLQFLSESRSIELYKTEIHQIRYRPNVHSILLLGRWISAEGVSGGKPIRLLVEPREKKTLLGNRLFGPKIRAALTAWLGKAK